MFISGRKGLENVEPITAFILQNSAGKYLAFMIVLSIVSSQSEQRWKSYWRKTFLTFSINLIIPIILQ